MRMMIQLPKTKLVRFFTATGVVALIVLTAKYCHLLPSGGANGPSSGGLGDGVDVVIYNRIPKTASTSFMHLVPYKLTKSNGITVAGLNVSGSGLSTYTLSFQDRFRLMSNMSSWVERFPAVYHGHFAYFGLPEGMKTSSSNAKVVWINMVRKPVDRMVSFYYFLRYGDDFRVNKVRSRMGDRVTFDDCIANSHSQDCDPRKLWLQVPWFCGHSRRCWSPPGNDWALDQAKRNLVEKYLVVGITEDLDSFVDVVEWLLPKFFKGAGSLYRNEGTKGNNHIRRTKHKDPVSAQTLEVLKKTRVWKAEQDFYDFALNQFNALKEERKRDLDSPDRHHFHYEKLRGVPSHS